MTCPVHAAFSRFRCGRGHDGGAAADASLPSGGVEAGHGAFADHPSFHLREGAEDVEQEFATGGGGVESFGERAEGDAALPESVDGVDEIAQGSAEPV